MSQKKQHITKISAQSGLKKAQTADKKPEKAPKMEKKFQKSPDKAVKKVAKKSLKPAEEKPIKEVFVLARPFVALGRYIRDSWKELRMVRWPNRKLTWKMTLSVLVYCAIFMVIILLLDTLFTFIFEMALKG